MSAVATDVARRSGVVGIVAADGMPFWTAALIGGLMIIAGVAVLATVNQCASGQIGRNRGVGIRTSATRASDEAWMAGHRAARPFLQFGAIAMFACGAVVFALSSQPAALFGLVVVGVGLLVVAALLGTVAANRAARATTT